MPRRMGRPGLVGTMARTAVVAGTATAVSGSMVRRQQGKAAAAQQEQAAQQAAFESQQQVAELQAQMAAMQAPPAAPEAPAATAAAPVSDDTMAQLQKLADMKAQGLLSDDEFAAMKAKLLGL